MIFNDRVTIPASLFKPLLMSKSLPAVPHEFLCTAIYAADQARTVTQRHFRTPLGITSKSDNSPVTIADKETESLICEILLSRHPDHGIFAEESGDQSHNNEWRWIVDPIDGTKSFATGNPTFGTLIALLHGEHPVLGIIDHAILDERWIGSVGKGTTFNAKLCHTSAVRNLDKASIYTTSLDMFNAETFARYDRLSKQCNFRVFGGDCYSYGLLASGFIDLICEADLKAYDYLALAPVIEGAGGILSDWQGEPVGFSSGDQILAAANKAIHLSALQMLND